MNFIFSFNPMIEKKIGKRHFNSHDFFDEMATMNFSINIL